MYLDSSLDGVSMDRSVQTADLRAHFKALDTPYLAVIDIHFFPDLIIDILFFNSDYFDSILKNCTNRIFSHVPRYFCG